MDSSRVLANRLRLATRWQRATKRMTKRYEKYKMPVIYSCDIAVLLRRYTAVSHVVRWPIRSVPDGTHEPAAGGGLDRCGAVELEVEDGDEQVVRDANRGPERRVGAGKEGKSGEVEQIDAPWHALKRKTLLGGEPPQRGTHSSGSKSISAQG